MATAKKTTKPSGDIVINAADRDNPHIKRYLREQALKAEREEISNKVPKLLTAAGELFGKKFATVSALIRYLSPRKAAKSKRGARITPEQKDKVKQLRKENQTDAQIAAALGLQEKQIKRVK